MKTFGRSRRSPDVKTMGGKSTKKGVAKKKTGKKSTKFPEKAVAKRIAAKAAKPRKAVAKSPARAPTNAAGKELRAHSAVPKAATESEGTAVAAKPTLLAGGNPQIAKGYGDAPVQAYIAAMPGWKRHVGKRLDALIVRTVPDVPKTVKWNSPLYHCFSKYVKVAFVRGTWLLPVPPGESKTEETRYLDIHEDDQLDEAQFADGVKRANHLTGERM